MRIEINLASRPYEDSRRFWTYWGTGLVLLALATLLLVFLAVTGFMRAGVDRRQISRLRAEITAYDQEKTRAEALLNRPENRLIRDRSRFLNELFERKAFSWTRVFEDLERVMPAHLHVVSIHPDMSSENGLALKLVVGGNSREQALDLIRKMEESRRFKQTRIDQVKFATEQGNTGDRVQFDITALYSPSAEAGAVSGGVN
ncbi:MAG: PilN domain-containing protein [Acidobacteria bacterium]|nr:PilN domain-containing protein [Acidobacteriota bacterium]